MTEKDSAELTPARATEGTSADESRPNTQFVGTKNQVICPSCDLINQRIPIEPHQVARCRRCNTVLFIGHQQDLPRMMALSLTGLLLLPAANLLPMLNMKLFGNKQSSTLFDGVLMLWERDFKMVAALVMFCSIIAPTILLSGLLVLSSLQQMKIWRSAQVELLKVVEWITHWSMLEVYLVSFMVSLIKLNDIADISFGSGLACFIALMIVNSMLLARYQPSCFWDRLMEYRCYNRDKPQ